MAQFRISPLVSSALGDHAAGLRKPQAVLYDVRETLAGDAYVNTLWVASLLMKWGLSLEQGPFFPRPGTAGFPPISALVGLKYWLQTGTISEVHPSGLFIFISVVAVSLLRKKSFCRWLSPIKIARDNFTRIDCDLCTKACAVKNTLDMRFPRSAKAVPNWAIGSLVAGTFVAITGLAMLTGHWENLITRQEYQRRFQQLDSPLYQHFGGHVPQYGPHD